MRKLLLASAAILGATGGLAFAQAPANQNQGQYAGPYGAGPAANNNNNAWGIANTPTGGAAAGPLSIIYAPNVTAVPAPGTVVIRLNGRVEVDMSAIFTSADKGVTNTGAPTGFKTSPLGIGSYMRLYPGFDGAAANGLRYGAAIELRENFASGVNAGAGAANAATATSPSANTSGQTVFVRRAFTYLASDKAGIVRFGQADGVLGLFDNCIFTSGCWDAGLGNFNGGANQSLSPSAGVAIPFVPTPHDGRRELASDGHIIPSERGSIALLARAHGQHLADHDPLDSRGCFRPTRRKARRSRISAIATATKRLSCANSPSANMS